MINNQYSCSDLSKDELDSEFPLQMDRNEGFDQGCSFMGVVPQEQEQQQGEMNDDDNNNNNWNVSGDKTEDVVLNVMMDSYNDDIYNKHHHDDEGESVSVGAIDEVQIHPFYNVFIGSPKLEKKYHRIRLKESAPLLRWVSALLLLCFLVDCILLVYRWPSVFIALSIILCSIVCFQLSLFIFRNRLYSHLLIHYYQYTTTALGTSAFAYFVFSDTLSMCVMFAGQNDLCSVESGFSLHPEDTTRVAYGMSLLFGILPFCFRIGFVYCVIMYVGALVVHLLLRTLAVLTMSISGSNGFIMFDSVFLDTLFLSTIMATILYGAYLYERNDRIMFLRMQRNRLESSQLQSELKMVREELTWAEDEANTNELKLEIERAKSDLDRMHPGAQLELESWVIPFEQLAIDKQLGEGSCGEVYRGHLRNLNPPDSARSGQSWMVASPSYNDSNYHHNIDTGPVLNLMSPPAHKFKKSSKSPDGQQQYVIMPPHHHIPNHSRQFSSIPSYSSVAVKRIPKHKINRKAVLSLLQETLVMSYCKHPNVLRLIGLVYDPYVCVIFEYMSLGSLKDLLVESSPQTLKQLQMAAVPPPNTQIQQQQQVNNQKNHPSSSRPESSTKSGFHAQKMSRDSDDFYKDEELKLEKSRMIESLTDNFTNIYTPVWTHIKTRMCVNVAAGVSYLHSKNIIHRDLKADNLMVDNTQAVKVADLGVARRLFQQGEENQQQQNMSRSSDRRLARPLSRVGSPLWIAPEVISSSDGHYDDKCDVWSFGVILCEIMTHRDPYTDPSGRSHFNLLQVVDGNLSPLDFIHDVLPNTPTAIVKLAHDCCKFDPKKRCSMKEALFILLQTVVQQETSKVAADAIAAAGPFLRYSQPSRKDLFRRHGSSAGPFDYDDDSSSKDGNSIGLPMGYRSRQGSMDKSSCCSVSSSVYGESVETVDNNNHDNILDHSSSKKSDYGKYQQDDDSDIEDTDSDLDDLDDDDDDDDALEEGGEVYSAKNQTYSSCKQHYKSLNNSTDKLRPISTSTVNTYATAISSPSTPSCSGKTIFQMEETTTKRILKRGFSTHNLGETVDIGVAQSLLSSYPSMGCMVHKKASLSPSKKTTPSASSSSSARPPKAPRRNTSPQLPGLKNRPSSSVVA